MGVSHPRPRAGRQPRRVEILRAERTNVWLPVDDPAAQFEIAAINHESASRRRHRSRSRSGSGGRSSTRHRTPVQFTLDDPVITDPSTESSGSQTPLFWNEDTPRRGRRSPHAGTPNLSEPPPRSRSPVGFRPPGIRIQRSPVAPKPALPNVVIVGETPALAGSPQTAMSHAPAAPASAPEASQGSRQRRDRRRSHQRREPSAVPSVTASEDAMEQEIARRHVQATVNRTPNDAPSILMRTPVSPSHLSPLPVVDQNQDVTDRWRAAMLGAAPQLTQRQAEARRRWSTPATGRLAPATQLDLPEETYSPSSDTSTLTNIAGHTSSSSSDIANAVITRARGKYMRADNVADWVDSQIELRYQRKPGQLVDISSLSAVTPPPNPDDDSFSDTTSMDDQHTAEFVENHTAQRILSEQGRRRRTIP